jgi:hypothetical protein
LSGYNVAVKGAAGCFCEKVEEIDHQFDNAGGLKCSSRHQYHIANRWTEEEEEEEE